MTEARQFIYLQFGNDLLRIEEPALGTLAWQQDQETNQELVDQENGLKRALKPEVGVGWTSEHFEDTFINDTKYQTLAVPIDENLVPSEDWKHTSTFKDNHGNIYNGYQVSNFFKKPISVANLLQAHGLKKYAALAEYFGELTVEDVLTLEEEDLVSAVATGKQQLLMKSFWRNELRKFTGTKTEYQTLSRRDRVVAPQLLMQQRRVVLDLQQKVTSIQFAEVPPTQILANKLVAKIKEVNLNPQFALDINLADCLLIDEDLIYVVQLLDYFSNCLRIDLSGNRFMGTHSSVDNVLLNMLDKDKYARLEYVNIVRNPIASSDRRDLFLTLNKSQLERLIWVPAAWLEGVSWKRMVKEEMYDTVIQTHQRYYKAV